MIITNFITYLHFFIYVYINILLLYLTFMYNISAYSTIVLYIKL